MQLTCIMALGYTKHIKTNFWLDGSLIHFLGEGFKIYVPRIEQSDWTVWMYHGTMCFIWFLSCPKLNSIHTYQSIDSSYCSIYSLRHTSCDLIICWQGVIATFMCMWTWWTYSVFLVWIPNIAEGNKPGHMPLRILQNTVIPAHVYDTSRRKNYENKASIHTHA